MNIWKFGPLGSRRDIVNGFALRLFWCAVGAILTFSIFADRLKTQAGLIVGVTIGIPVLGAFADAYRLKHPQISTQRLRLIAMVVFAIIFLGLVIVQLAVAN